VHPLCPKGGRGDREALTAIIGDDGNKLQKNFLSIQIIFRHLPKCLNILNLLFKALNDPTRREILELLKDKDMQAGEIASQFNMSWPSVSHHLDLLKRAGLVVAVKEGQYQYYSINTTVMDEMLKWLMRFTEKKK